jgi:glutaredoxin-like protein NrdH
MPITVYTKPGCVQCNATYRALDKKGIPYRSLDISQDPEALEALKARGVQQAPAVETPTDFWTGFRPDKIDELAIELGLN